MQCPQEILSRSFHYQERIVGFENPWENFQGTLINGTINFKDHGFQNMRSGTVRFGRPITPSILHKVPAPQ